MAALDFPSSPTLNQQYTGTNGVLYTWDGAVWGVSGPASGQPAGGDLQGTYPSPTVIPAARSKWTDSGTTLTPTDATKTVTIPGTTTSGAAEILGPTTGTARTRLMHHPTAYQCALAVNRDWLSANAQDDATRPSWGVRMASDVADNFVVQRAAAGAPGTQVSLLECRGSDGKTYCTLADRSVNQVMHAVGSTMRTYASAVVPGNFNSNNVLNQWVGFVTVGITTQGGWVLVDGTSVGLMMAGAAGNTSSNYVALMRDGNVLTYRRLNFAWSAGGTASIVVPTMSCIDNIGAGAHTYQAAIWSTNTSWNFTTPGTNDGVGNLQVSEWC